MKFLTAIFVCLAIPLFGATTNLPISQLPSVTAIASGDLFLITINPGTTPASRKATLTSVNNSLRALNVTPLPSTNGTARALRLEDDLTIGTSIRVTNAATGEFWDYTASGTNAFARQKDITNHVGSITIGSLGAGTSLVGTPAGLAFKLLSIIPGLNITITNNNNQIGISAAQTGETNLLGSVGTGTSIAGTKSGLTLNVKSIAAGNAYLNISADSATLTLAPTNLLTLDTSQSVTGRKQIQDTTSKYMDLGNKSGTVTVPWNTNVFKLTATGDIAYQFSGSSPTNTEVAVKTLLYYQDGTGSRLLTVGGTNIPVKPSASALTIVSFMTTDGGTNLAIWSSYPGPGLGDPGTNGILSRTANGATFARTLTGTASQISVSNGDGVSGDPVFSFPNDLAITTSLTVNGFSVVTNLNGTNITGSAAALAAASAQTNYIVPLLPGVGPNLLQVNTANTNVFISFTGTNVANATRSVFFNGWTNTVVITFSWSTGTIATNYNISTYLTNGQSRIYNFYNLDTTGTNVLMSDTGIYRR